MVFGRKKDQTRRARQPNLPAGAGAQPVFSYHARTPRPETADGTRRANKLLWLSPSKPSPRPQPRTWPRRTVTLVVGVLAVVLLVNSLFLGRNPEIVAADLAPGQQALLQDTEEYRVAAREILASSLANTNKITLDTAKVSAAMISKFPELATVAIELPAVGRNPIFHIKPASPALLLKSGGETFVIDGTGRAVASATTRVAKMNLPVAEDQSGLPLAVGDPALPGDDISFIQEVLGQLKAKQIAVAGLVLPRGTSELDIRLEGQPYLVKFNLRGDARAEVGAFLATKQHLEREHKTPSAYIDVRVDNKVYYR